MSPRKSSFEIATYKRGKHLGHALEAHCRALLARLAPHYSCTVSRELPFEFPVHPDAVVLDAKGRLRALGMVSFCSKAADGKKASDNSSLKFYRTRFEYNAALKESAIRPELFSADFRLFVLIYGSKDGWKDILVRELQEHHPTTLFLPSHMSESELAQMIERVWNVYAAAFKGRPGAATKAVFEHFIDDKTILLVGERKLLPLLQSAAFDASVKRRLAVIRRKLANKNSESSAKEDVAPEILRTRYRQGLALASVFRPSEINAWRALPTRKDNIGADAESFVRRAIFMGLAEVAQLPSLLGPRLSIELRRPEKLVAAGAIYAPEKPDFVDWLRLEPSVLIGLLGLHRSLPFFNRQSFGAGAHDQIGGNWRGFCSRYYDGHDRAQKALRTPKELASFLRLESTTLGVEEWHPSRFCEPIRFWWSVFVCIAATVKQDRKIFRNGGVRRTTDPTAEEAEWLASLLVSTASLREQTSRLLLDVDAYCQHLAASNVTVLARLTRPELLSLDRATSIASWWYGALTTNPSYNPLSWIALAFLETKYPGIAWSGFPSKRSARLVTFLPSHSGRVEWSLIGRMGRALICCEPRTITANNMGNKTKEIFDRIQETRQAARGAGLKLTTIGILDGDFDAEALSRLTGTYGYDCVVSIDRALAEIGGAASLLESGNSALSRLAGEPVDVREDVSDDRDR